MPLPIHVTAYSGYKANERPGDFTVDEDFYRIADVEDRWYESDAMYFKVRTMEGKRYIRPYDEAELIAKLDQVDALIIEASPNEAREGNLQAKLRALVSEPLFERLTAAFEMKPLYPCYTLSILRKRQER